MLKEPRAPHPEKRNSPSRIPYVPQLYYVALESSRTCAPFTRPVSSPQRNPPVHGSPTRGSCFAIQHQRGREQRAGRRDLIFLRPRVARRQYAKGAEKTRTRSGRSVRYPFPCSQRADCGVNFDERPALGARKDQGKNLRESLLADWPGNYNE